MLSRSTQRNNTDGVKSPKHSHWRIVLTSDLPILDSPAWEQIARSARFICPVLDFIEELPVDCVASLGLGNTAKTIAGGRNEKLQQDVKRYGEVQPFADPINKDTISTAKS